MTNKQVETYANALQTAPSKRAKRAKSKWVYSGDVNLRQGGFYFRDDGTGTIDCVEVIPESETGGPDNIFLICIGSIHISDDPALRRSALECVGADRDAPTRSDLIHAFKYWGGVSNPTPFYVQIGFKVDSFWRGEGVGYKLPALDERLRSNADLRNFVRKTFMR